MIVAAVLVLDTNTILHLAELLDTMANKSPAGNVLLAKIEAEVERGI